MFIHCLFKNTIFFCFTFRITRILQHIGLHLCYGLWARTVPSRCSDLSTQNVYRSSRPKRVATARRGPMLVWHACKCNYIHFYPWFNHCTVPCDAEYHCDENASCKWIEGDMQHKCICNEGYTGDGYECLLESCQIVCGLCF